jgi:phage terminase small subunit
MAKKPKPPVDERNLEPRQERFVQEYLIDLNATQAAIRAGYSKKTARQQGDRLLSKAAVAAAIALAQAKRAERVEITQDYVLEKIRETVERCSQGVPVLDMFGRPVLTKTPAGVVGAVYKFDAKAVLQGCNLLGQHLAMWKTVLTGKDGKPLEVTAVHRVIIDSADPAKVKT